MFRLRRTALCAALLAIAPVLIPHALPSAVAQTVRPHGLVGPKKIYMALGDSLAYGFQPKIDWNHGYAEDWYDELKSHGVSKHVNYSCPGESLQTFIYGGCALHAIVRTKFPKNESQLTAALTYINQHKGQVSPVSIDIGANDFNKLFDPTTCTILTDTQGISNAVQTFDANFTYVLKQLKGALNNQGDLFTMNYYNPYADICPSQVPFIAMLMQHLEADANAVGVPWVDVYYLFNIQADEICNWTWMCQPKPKNISLKIHPNDTGYTQIYQGFSTLAGY